MTQAADKERSHYVPDLSLRENTVHGTPKNPIWALHFTAGPGTAYPDHFFVERHWHDYAEILLILKGDYRIEINLEEQILHEGDLCILNSGELHQITGLQTEAVHDALLFDPQILNFSYADEWEESCIAPFLKQSVLIQNLLHPEDPGYPELHGLSARLIGLALGREKDWYIRCKLLLLEWFRLLTVHQRFLPARENLSPGDARRVERYKALVSYIETHYQEPLSLQQLSELIHCNRQYLCRFFRETAGVSPIQYLISCRIDHACALLADTSQSVTDIALNCGFDNISYFIRAFRAHKGCTPREYRVQRKKQG